MPSQARFRYKGKSAELQSFSLQTLRYTLGSATIPISQVQTMKSQKVPSLAQGHIARKQIWTLPVPDGIFHSEQAPRLPPATPAHVPIYHPSMPTQGSGSSAEGTLSDSV